MNASDSSDRGRDRPTRSVLWAIVLLALLLRLIHVDSQLWIDEISAFTGSIDRPIWAIATEWPGAASHVFYEILARLSLVAFGVEPWAIRLPAVLAGVAGVLALYAVAVRFLPVTAALLSAALAAVSFHHVFYSQNARGYTLLMLCFLVASERLIAMDRKGRVERRDGLIYAGAGALGAYSQIFGIVVVPAQLIAVAALGWNSRRSEGVPLRAFLPWAAGSIAVTAVLYAPFVLSVLEFMSATIGVEAAGERIGLGLVAETIDGLAAGLGGLPGLGIAAAVALLGTASWLRRDHRSLIYMMAPLVLELGVLIGLGAGVHPRYFAIALPIALIVGAAGVDAVVKAAVTSVVSRGALRRGIVAGILTAIAILAAYPLLRYYRYPKQDFKGALEILDARASPTDVELGIHVAGNAIRAVYRPDFVTVQSLPELRAVEATGRRIWLVTTLETILGSHDPDLLGHIRQEYERVAFLPGTVGDGHVRVYVREGASQ